MHAETPAQEINLTACTLKILHGANYSA